MVKTADHTKRERRRERAEAKAAALRRRQHRRRLGWALGAAAVVGAIAIGWVAFLGGDGEPGTGPSRRADVVVAGPGRSEPLAPGEAVPDFTAPGLHGGTISWESYVGRPTLLAVWAPWCPHCQVELPILDRVMRDHPNMGFVTLVTAVGDRPGPTPEGYLRDHGLTFPVAVDDERGTVSDALGVPGFPMLYFVDSDGRVRIAVSGEVDEATLVEALSKLS
jgi:cytochrome c biogenesis protein CcmG, thiol:disulfide interchange protein DsbE